MGAYNGTFSPLGAGLITLVVLGGSSINLGEIFNSLANPTPHEAANPNHQGTYLPVPGSFDNVFLWG